MKSSAKKKSTTQTKKKKNIGLGVAHILATFNNTIITFTDVQGNVIASSSAGENKFKGAKKATPYAAQITASKAADEAVFHGMKTLTDVVIKGAGIQREAAACALFSRFVVMRVKDATPVPFNGTKSPKRRRV